MDWQLRKVTFQLALRDVVVTDRRDRGDQHGGSSTCSSGSKSGKVALDSCARSPDSLSQWLRKRLVA